MQILLYCFCKTLMTYCNILGLFVLNTYDKLILMIRWHVHLHYMYLYNVSFQKVCRMWIILASSARGWDVHRKCCRDNNYRAGRALMAPALWTGHYCRSFHSGELSSNNFSRLDYFHIFNVRLICFTLVRSIKLTTLITDVK